MFQAVIESPNKFIVHLITSDNVKIVNSICTIKRSKGNSYYEIINELTEVIGTFVRNSGYIKGEITYKDNKYLFRSSRYKEIIVLNNVVNKVHPFSRGIKLGYKEKLSNTTRSLACSTVRKSSYNNINNFNLIDSLVKKQSKENYKKGYVYVKYLQQAKFFCKEDVIYIQDIFNYDGDWIEETLKTIQKDSRYIQRK